MANQYEIVNQHELQEYEMLYLENELSSKIEPTFPESNSIVFVCRYCNEDDSKGELIRPCECTDDQKFTHINCLRTLVRARRTFHCIHCNTPFPLRFRNKPLIMWCRCHAFYNVLLKLCVNFFAIIILMYYNICYIFLFGISWKFISFSKPGISITIVIVNILLLFMCLLSKLYERILLTDLTNGLRNAYFKWVDENREIEVIKRPSEVKIL